MNAICSQLEVANDVISSQLEEAFRNFIFVNLLVANSAVFEKIEISNLCNMQTTVDPLEPHFRGQEAKMSNGLQSSLTSQDPKGQI